MRFNRISVLALALGAGVVLAGAGFAADPSQREATMKQVSHAYKKLIALSRNGTFDAATNQENAAKITAALDQFKDMFPAGSEKADDKAGPNIWTDRAGFDTARTNAYDAALAVSKATDLAGFQSSFKTLAGTCKACHDKYRLSD